MCVHQSQNSKGVDAVQEPWFSATQEDSATPKGVLLITLSRILVFPVSTWPKTHTTGARSLSAVLFFSDNSCLFYNKNKQKLENFINTCNWNQLRCSLQTNTSFVSIVMAVFFLKLCLYQRVVRYSFQNFQIPFHQLCILTIKGRP